MLKSPRLYIKLKNKFKAILRSLFSYLKSGDTATTPNFNNKKRSHRGRSKQPPNSHQTATK
ncbi:hypothetical protein UR07_11185 [Pasteurella multocida subsp. multocida]|nr:hypothetical protein UR07_11185 [Pasteurella multocida subsp. multocida]